MLNRLLIAWAVTLLMLTAATVRSADEQAAQLQKLLAEKAPAIVTIKVVIKTEYKAGGEGRDDESQLTLQGAIVDPSGLVMLSNTPFSTSRMTEMFGEMGGGGSDFGIKITPRGFKVTIEQEEKELDAFLAATDTQLDLVFVQIEGLAERKLTAISFENAASVGVGEKLLSISRLQKGFDYAPYFQSATISGELTKPRKAWVLDSAPAGFGLPLYTASGDAVGVLTTLSPGLKDEGAQNQAGFGMFMRLMSGGGAAPTSAFVLPGQTIKGVIEQAKKRAAEIAEERAKKKGGG